MAIGKASDFVVYQDEVRGAVVERLTQASDFFNSAGGGISMSTVSKRGEYAKETFFQNISSLVTRRDTTSTSAATDLASTMDEIISVKLNRKVGPVAQTLDAFRKVELAAGEDSLSFLIGTQVAKAMEVDMLNACLRSGVAALNNQSTAKYTVPSSGTITSEALVDGLSLFGDQGSRINTWVMHSKVFYDLMKYQISASTGNGDNVAAVAFQQASPLTLNRPVIVTDSDALLSSSGSPETTSYYTLGLTNMGLMCENTEEELMYSELVTGLENIVVRLQGEFAYNAGVKGFKWDTSGGGANPVDADLGTGSNWDPAFDNVKDWAGFLIQSQ